MTIWRQHRLTKGRIYYSYWPEWEGSVGHYIRSVELHDMANDRQLERHQIISTFTDWGSENEIGPIFADLDAAKATFLILMSAGWP